MLYNALKILHIMSAALLLTSIVYTFKLWLTHSLEKIQLQTWGLFIPTAIFQLATGFTMISLKQYNLSDIWIIGSLGGFMVLIISWFGFLYLLSTRAKKLQIALLATACITLLVMIFLMANKIL